MLEVTVYNIEDGEIVEDPHTDVDFVSLISPDTYGPPALVAPNNGRPPAASLGEKVLYINTALIPMFSITRKEDR